MWSVTLTVVPVVIGELGAVTPKLGEWLQQIARTTSEISIQKSAILGTSKILCRARGEFIYISPDIVQEAS